jgi:hypothetical protein
MRNGLLRSLVPGCGLAAAAPTAQPGRAGFPVRDPPAPFASRNLPEMKR